MTSHSEGRKGEARAANYFKRRGYRVEARNYRTAVGEIDLIVSKGEWLVFAEVKLRRGGLTGSALEAVSPRQVKRVCAAAAAFLAMRETPAPSCRFDIVTLGPEKDFWGRLKLRHYENAHEAQGQFSL